MQQTPSVQSGKRERLLLLLVPLRERGEREPGRKAARLSRTEPTDSVRVLWTPETGDPLVSETGSWAPAALERRIGNRDRGDSPLTPALPSRDCPNLHRTGMEGGPPPLTRNQEWRPHRRGWPPACLCRMFCVAESCVCLPPH